MDSTKLQEAYVLQDISPTGRQNDWGRRKMANELLAIAYEDVNKRKAERLRNCATWLSFAAGADGRPRLHDANFCRVRLCPICQWRRALKTYSHTRSIVEAMTTDYRARKKGLRWMMLTLTVRNCTGDDLSAMLDAMTIGWHRLIKSKAMEPVMGWYRGLEITHDCAPYITRHMMAEPGRAAYYAARGLAVGDSNPNYGKYHPHYHCLLAVNTRYMRRDYPAIRADWVAAWRRSMRLDYDPVIDIRKTYSTTAQVVAEASKYTVKDMDYIQPADWDMTVDTVRLLDKALDKRRLIAYGGDCKIWHHKLNLDDEETGDLVHTDDDITDMDIKASEVVYYWSTGYRQYIAAL